MLGTTKSLGDALPFVTPSLASPGFGSPRAKGFLRAMLLNSRRQATLFAALAFIFLLALFYHHDDILVVPKLNKSKPFRPEDRITVQPTTSADVENFHLLLPASNGQGSLCKTLLTASVLGYPAPTLIAWNETFKNENLIGDGRYIAKILGVLDWLESQPSSNDDDVVLVADGYGGFNFYNNWDDKEAHLDGDMWFQLPVEVLVARYHAVIEKANRDLAARMGKAYEKEGLRESILFAAAKRCTPNNPGSAACYSIPSGPLPHGLYPSTFEGKLGPPDYHSHRQRYLSSAFTIGPVREMRAMFRRAKDKAHALIEPRPTSHAFDERMRLGSDQVIFHMMLGEQEFQREAMRRRHGERPRRPTLVEHALVRDVLSPSYPHDPLIEKEGRSDEFGMGIDYWSDLGQHMIDSEGDGDWLIYNRPIDEQIATEARHPNSCYPHVSGQIPAEILNSTSLPRLAVSDASQFSPLHGWDEPPFYTNICLGTIPVMVSHNGDQSDREHDWPRMWMQPFGRRLIEEVIASSSEDGHVKGGAYAGVGGDYVNWDDLCPAELERELYRDYYDPDSI